MRNSLLLIAILSLNFSFLNTTGQNYIDSLKQVEYTSRIDTVRFNALKKIAIAYSDSAYQKSLDYWNKALDLARRKRNRSAMADVYHQIGFMYLRKGEFPLALQELESALAVYEFVGLKKEMGHVYNDIGLVYKSWGRYEQALVNYLAAQNLFGEINDDEGLAMTSNNIGQIYYYREEYQKSIRYFEQYLSVNSRKKNQRAVAGAANNIASAYLELKEYDKALDFYLRSMRIYDSLGVKFGIAILQDNIGTLYTKKGQYNDALLYHTNALTILREIGSKPRYSYVLMNIGLNYYNLNNYPKALEYLLESKKIADELNQKENLKEIYYNLSNIYNAINEFDDALLFHKRYTLMKDSLMNAETAEKLSTIEAQFEADKKSRELLIIKSKLEQQKTLILVSIAIGIIFLFMAILLVRENIQKKKALAAVNQQTTNLNHAIQKILSHSNQGMLLLKSRFFDTYSFPADLSVLNNFALWVNPNDFFTTLFVACFNNQNNDIELVKSKFYSWFFEIYKDPTSLNIDNIISSINEKFGLKSGDESILNEAFRSFGCLIFDHKKSMVHYCGNINYWMIKSNSLVKLISTSYEDEFQNKSFDVNEADSIYLLATSFLNSSIDGTDFANSIDKTLSASLTNSFQDRNQLISSTIDFWKTSNKAEEETLFLSIKL